MLLILHGSSTLKVLAILGLNYRIAKMPKSGLVERYWPGIVIVGNMLILFMNERNDGYRFAHLHGAFEVVVSTLNGGRIRRLIAGSDGRTASPLAYQFQHHHVENRLFCS